MGYISAKTDVFIQSGTDSIWRSTLPSPKLAYILEADCPLKKILHVVSLTGIECVAHEHLLFDTGEIICKHDFPASIRELPC